LLTLRTQDKAKRSVTELGSRIHREINPRQVILFQKCKHLILKISLPL
jgi:hypothetical protein